MFLSITSWPRLKLALALGAIDDTLNWQQGKPYPGKPRAVGAPRSFCAHRAMNRAIGLILPEVLGPFEEDRTPVGCAA